jgi:hypothetical protein
MQSDLKKKPHPVWVGDPSPAAASAAASPLLPTRAQLLLGHLRMHTIGLLGRHQTYLSYRGDGGAGGNERRRRRLDTHGGEGPALPLLFRGRRERRRVLLLRNHHPRFRPLVLAGRRLGCHRRAHLVLCLCVCVSQVFNPKRACTAAASEPAPGRRSCSAARAPPSPTCAARWRATPRAPSRPGLREVSVLT